VPLRFWAAAGTLFVSALSAASGQVSAAKGCAEQARPTSLDYLALASMAYSQRPLAMAAYRPQQLELAAPDAPRVN
jgi:hypothetical protein